jgi:hypothetical protein
MGLDFTFKKYKELCNAIKKNNYPLLCVRDYFKNPDRDRFIILRHDVDKIPENAFAMAQLENTLGIKSTYYFRTIKEVFDPEIIKKISELEHEIGYHYETLSEAEGDYNVALKMFEKDLKTFRKVVEIKTICMHGSPLSKWNNSDLWKKYDYTKYGIIGEPYIAINYDGIGYFTDTGRTWCNRGSVRDNVDDSKEYGKDVKTTDDLMELIKTQEFKRLIIVAHPQRWSLKSSKWLKELVAQNIKNVGKDLILKRKRK